MERHLNILSVDDEPSVGLSLSFALDSSNRKVTNALDGQDALAKIAAHAEPFDVVIIDNKMPGMSGLDFVRGLRARDFGGKIIVLAAELTEENRRAYTGLNVDTIFLKPFDLHQLRQGVDLPKAARPLVRTQINQIRRDVQTDGEGFATCQELRVLCPNDGTFARQLGRVTQIAQQEGWNFAFLTDGSVRFAAR